MFDFIVAVTDYGIIQRYFARFDENFFQFCDKELAKINTFFYGSVKFVNYLHNICLKNNFSETKMHFANEFKLY